MMLLKVSLLIVGALPCIICLGMPEDENFVYESNIFQVLDDHNKLLKTDCGELVNLSQCLSDGNKGVSKLYSYPCDCGRYITCVNMHRFLIAECPPGTLFNEPSGTCTWRHKANTDDCVKLTL